MIVIKQIIIPKWKINFTENYVVSHCGKVINLKTNKIIKMQLKQYTKGYYLHGKFYSLSKLRKSLVKVENNYCPF